jgi:hypothetical protein
MIFSISRKIKKNRVMWSFFLHHQQKKDSHMNFNGCGRDVEICWTYPIAWIRDGLWGCIDDISAQLYLLSMIWFHRRMDAFQFGVIIIHHNISKVTWHRYKSHPSSSQHLNLFSKFKIYIIGIMMLWCDMWTM